MRRWRVLCVFFRRCRIFCRQKQSLHSIKKKKRENKNTLQTLGEGLYLHLMVGAEEWAPKIY